MAQALSILGLGVASALGAGVDSLRKGLAGQAKPRIEIDRVEGARGEVALPVYRASDDGLERFMARRAVRRIDRFSRFALLASYLAVENADLGESLDPSRLGIAFGSGYGPLETTFQFQDSTIDDGDKCASPTAFANSVHNAPASHVSIALGAQGPCTTITTFGHTVGEVLCTAATWLERGEADYVLAGAGENYSPVWGYALARDAAEWPGEMRPLDFDACTALPGEGFVVFVIARAREGGGGVRLIDVASGDEAPEALAQASRVFVAARGVREEGTAYAALAAASGDAPIEAHAALYGSMPTGLAFEVALAAASAGPDERIACASCDGQDATTVVVVGK